MLLFVAHLKGSATLSGTQPIHFMNGFFIYMPVPVNVPARQGLLSGLIDIKKIKNPPKLMPFSYIDI